MGLLSKILCCTQKKNDIMYTDRKLMPVKRAGAIIINSPEFVKPYNQQTILNTEKFDDNELNDLLTQYSENKGLIETSSDEDEDDKSFIFNTEIYKFEVKCIECKP